MLKNIDKKTPGEICKSNIEYLTDRVLVTEDKKQEFGTQFHINNKNRLVLKPVKNRKQVNKRRVEYGLRTIEEYIEDAKNYIPPKSK